jgi:uncharacterized protein (DUF302 family)
MSKMKKHALLLLFSSLLFTACDNSKGAFIDRVASIHDHATTVKRLQTLITQQQLTLFHTIDHTANAKAVKMNLKPETLVVFGNPKMGTVLMNCNPSMGLDLPLRILVTTNYEGITTLSYTNPEYWSLKHNVKDKKCLQILNRAKIALSDLAQKAGEK